LRENRETFRITSPSREFDVKGREVGERFDLADDETDLLGDAGAGELFTTLGRDPAPFLSDDFGKAPLVQLFKIIPHGPFREVHALLLELP
jgi:hypothetical protein